MFAVVYADETREEKSIWYPTRRKAEEAKERVKRGCRIEVVKV
jgi:hypothetical protein